MLRRALRFEPLVSVRSLLRPGRTGISSAAAVAEVDVCCCVGGIIVFVLVLVLALLLSLSYAVGLLVVGVGSELQGVDFGIDW